MRPRVAVGHGVGAALLLLLLSGTCARQALLLALRLSHLEAQCAGQELTPAQQADLHMNTHTHIYREWTHASTKTRQQDTTSPLGLRCSKQALHSCGPQTIRTTLRNMCSSPYTGAQLPTPRQKKDPRTAFSLCRAPTLITITPSPASCMPLV